MSSNSFTLIPFDGKDFALWKIKAAAYVAGRGWYDVVNDESKDEDFGCKDCGSSIKGLCFFGQFTIL